MSLIGYELLHGKNRANILNKKERKFWLQINSFNQTSKIMHMLNPDKVEQLTNKYNSLSFKLKDCNELFIASTRSDWKLEIYKKYMMLLHKNEKGGIGYHVQYIYRDLDKVMANIIAHDAYHLAVDNNAVKDVPKTDILVNVEVENDNIKKTSTKKKTNTKKKIGTRKKWTADDVKEFIKIVDREKVINMETFQKVADELGRSIKSITTYWYNGLVKTYNIYSIERLEYVNTILQRIDIQVNTNCDIVDTNDESGNTTRGDEIEMVEYDKIKNDTDKIVLWKQTDGTYKKIDFLYEEEVKKLFKSDKNVEISELKDGKVTILAKNFW